jgi:hypothetical protein
MAPRDAGGVGRGGRDRVRRVWFLQPRTLTRANYGNADGREQTWAPRGGCAIDWFDDDGVQIRLKSSYASTYRAGRCTGCAVYCQEGFYGLKHSVEGWVTPCPSGAQERGVHLPAGLDDAEAQTRLGPLLAELSATRRVDNSFDEFLRRRGLAVPSERLRLPVLDVAGGSRG